MAEADKPVKVAPRKREVGAGAVLPSVLATVGNTPTIELKRFAPELGSTLFAKLEGFNPAGSVKDRPALRIIEKAITTGRLAPGMVVVESSSGNMGLGLAQACLYYDLRLICVVDPKTSQANINILRAYGAEVDCVREPDPATGDFLPARLKRVEQWLARVPNAFWPNQYANEENSRSHAETTMAEILAACGELDYLICATSTCGTVRGCAEAIRERGSSAKVIAVDAVGSVIFGGDGKKRLLPGMGAAIVPPLCKADAIDRVILVTDLESVIGCRRLLRSEALLVGASSGAVAWAATLLLREVPAGSRACLIFADRGERYLDTVFSDTWVEDHFGDVRHLWAPPRPAADAVRKELVSSLPLHAANGG